MVSTRKRSPVANTGNEEFALGYSAGMRSMLISINSGGSGDFKVGDNPNSISKRKTMSNRLKQKILEAVGLA